MRQDSTTVQRSLLSEPDGFLVRGDKLAFLYKCGSNKFNLVNQHLPVLLVNSLCYIRRAKRFFSATLVSKF